MNAFRHLLALTAACVLCCAACGQDFVQRTGTHLTVAGAPFRYSGPNIEWLGLEGYGLTVEGEQAIPLDIS